MLGMDFSLLKISPQPSEIQLGTGKFSAFFDLIFPLKSDLPANWLVLLWTVFLFYNTQKKHLQCYAVGLLCGTNAWRPPGEA
jgi:hypothetical protein